MIFYIGKEPEIKTGIYELSTQEKLLSWLDQQAEIQVDTETEFNTRNKKALPNPHEHKVLSIQLGDSKGQNQYVIDPQYFDVQILKPYFEDTKIIKVFTNAFFDLRFFFHYGFNTKNIYDCFLAEMSFTLGKKMPEGSRSLKGMTKKYCQVDLDKDIRGKIHFLGLTEEVIKYGADDVKYMGTIKEKQLQEAIRLDLNNELKLNNRFAITLAKMSYKGFNLDKQAWLDNAKENAKLSSEELQVLNEYVINLNDSDFLETKQEILDSGEDMFIKTCKINWNSSKQVIKLMKKLGVSTQVRDKIKGGMKDSVDSKNLTKQKDKFDIIPLYLKYKEIEKEVSTYGTKFLKDNVCPITGRIHAEFFPLLATGRISSSNPNLQNITSKDDKGNTSPLRKCFIPTNENDVLIIADYSQQEPRLTAEYSQDPFLIDFIINGDGDSHNLTSTAISEFLLGEHVKVTKLNNPFVPKFNQKIRDIGKMINLGLDYGKTAFSVKDDLGTSQEIAQKLIDTLKAKTPEKQKYFQKCIDFVKKNGYIRIDEVTNRISYFDQYSEYLRLKNLPYEERTKKENSEFYKVQGALERFSQNYKIQGSGATMVKLAAIMFEDELETLGIKDAWILNMIHDEILVNCSKENAERVAKLLEKNMIEAGKYICKTIPMKVDLIIGDNWGSKT